MGRWIDTDAAYAVLTDYYHHSTDTQHAALREALGRVESVDAVPVVRCKDCKHWRDSDGVYRRGTGAESKCPLNTKEVYAGTFYCGYAERRTDERTD